MSASWAAEPTLHEVYQAVEAGKLKEADTMMAQVLKAHPGSARAHYVEAEILAKEGQMDKARDE
jgi:Tfp pilus assembly protein PilF